MLKNQTGEGRYRWGQPFALPQWQAQQGWVPPQNWMQPQGGVPSQGWVLPSSGNMPMPGWVPPSVQQTRQPYLWSLFDDSKSKFSSLIKFKLVTSSGHYL